MARKLGRPNTGKPFSASTDVKEKPKRVKASRKDPSNAYTFIPSLPKRHRTSEQTLSLTRDEAIDAKDSRRSRKDEADSDDDMQARIRKVAMMIAQDDGGEVESDESDVDSDEAWEADGSDEDRWGDVFRDLKKGSSKKAKGKAVEERTLKPKKPLTVNLDESEDEEQQQAPMNDEHEDDDEDEDEEDDDEDDDEEISAGGDLGTVEEDEEEEDDEDEDSEEDSDLELPSDLSADEDEPDTLDGLDAFVSKLADGDKKRKSVVETAEPAKKRRVLPVVSGPALGDGNDLGLKSGSKVDIASLIASHPSLSGASSLLPAKSKKDSADVLKQGTLAAPLPTIVQDRLNREAAYEKTKEEGAKWSTLMKRVKEAEHLQFPLQGTDRGGVKSTGEILAEFKPQNSHESAVQALLAKANLTETGVKQSEDEALRGKELSMEEIEERRAALRSQRELMFREEAKAKRVAKIKSKTFRKLARKRAAKQGEADLEAMDEEEADERREKMERERARERATLKHSARTGRWARDGNAGGEERQEARAEMFATKERLKRRIEGRGDGSESDESEDDGSEGDEDDIRRNAFDQLAKVDEGKQEVQEKGLMGMKFMQKAEERKRQARLDDEAALKADLEMFGDSDAEGGSADEGEKKSSMMKIGGTGGRMVFFGPQTNGNEASNPMANPSSSAQPKSTRFDALRSSSPPAASSESNPWLSAASASGPSRKRNTILGANSSAADKASASLKKAKSAAGGQGAIDDDEVEIETDGNKLLRQQEGEADSEGEQDELLPRKKGVRFGQRDLVAEAFAGDNVVEEFAAEKAKIVEADAPKVEDTSLPGWGSWSGKGTKKRKTNPKFLKTIPGLLETERKDAKFQNVIISEKKDKKASAFQVKDLPYPYTSVSQYEKRFENPLGAEWNSRAGHQRGTLPRVTKKKGAIIEPVRRLF